MNSYNWKSDKGVTLVETGLQYCTAATMHGLVYIAVLRSLIVQVYWGIMFIVCLSFGSVIVISSFNLIQSNPFLRNLDFDQSTIFDVQYPNCSCRYLATNRFGQPQMIKTRMKATMSANVEIKVSHFQFYFSELTETVDDLAKKN